MSWSHVTVIRGGNILDSQCSTITVTTNCVGVMGAGLAKSAANKYPDILSPYRIACNQKSHTTSRPLHILRERGTNILCFATKQHWRNPSRVEWVESGLQWLVHNQSQFESIAIPPLGCGLGGLNFDRDLRPLLIKYLPQLNIPIELYLK